MPEWVNPAMVERGQQVQAVYSSLMGPALFAGSLVGGSMFKSAAVVTALAGNLTNEPARRTNETALIIANLIFSGNTVHDVRFSIFIYPFSCFVFDILLPRCVTTSWRPFA